MLPGNCGGTDISCGIFPSCVDCTLTFQICDTITNTCINPVCGNNILEGIEVCDGSELNGETCISQGFASGNLACNAACTGFDTSSCIPLALSLSPIQDITFLGFETLPNINLNSYTTYNGQITDLSYSLTETNPSLVDCNIVALNQIQCNVVQNIDGFSDVTVQVDSTAGLTATATFKVNVQETYRESICAKIADPDFNLPGEQFCSWTINCPPGTELSTNYDPPLGGIIITSCDCFILCKKQYSCFYVQNTACVSQPSCDIANGWDAYDTNICTPPACMDADGDGYDKIDPLCLTGNDCNDNVNTIHPGAIETACDAIDQDCVGGDFAGTDNDFDTYKIEGGFCGTVDCNDANNAVNPGASEICSDTLDNNCDLKTDCEDITNCEGQSCGLGKICSFGGCVPQVASLSMTFENINYQLIAGVHHYYHDRKLIESNGVGVILTSGQVCLLSIGCPNPPGPVNYVIGPNGELILLNHDLFTNSPTDTFTVTYWGTDDNGNPISVQESLNHP